MKTLKTGCMFVLLACGFMVALGWSTANATVGSTYTNGAVNGTVDVTIKVTQRNDLEIQCDCSDVAGNFATATPNWSVTGIVKRDKKCFVRLTRSSAETADETVTVTGPKDRGRKGTVSATMNTTVVDKTSGAPSFASFDPIPALSMWGVVVLIAALSLAAILAIRKRRFATVA